MKKSFLILIAIFTSIVIKAQTGDSPADKGNKKANVHFDVFAKFTKGDFDEFIQRHVKYPGGQSWSFTGPLDIAYSVDNRGNVVKVRVLNNLAPAISRELVRVFNTSPKWIPATLHGKEVEIDMIMSLWIKLNAINKTIEATKPPPPHQETAEELAEQENEIFTSVEVMPAYPGGREAFLKYLAENIVYPRKALQDNIGGRVGLNFVVEKDGSPTNFVLNFSPSNDLTYECARVLQKYKFTPASQNGHLVRVMYSTVINFDPANPTSH